MQCEKAAASHTQSARRATAVTLGEKAVAQGDCLDDRVLGESGTDQYHGLRASDYLNQAMELQNANVRAQSSDQSRRRELRSRPIRL